MKRSEVSASEEDSIEIPYAPLLLEVEEAVHHIAENNHKWDRHNTATTYTFGVVIQAVFRAQRAIQKVINQAELEDGLASAMAGILDLAAEYDIDMEEALRRYCNSRGGHPEALQLPRLTQASGSNLIPMVVGSSAK